MAQTTGRRDEQLQIRLDAETRRTLQRAADTCRKTIGQFVLATALEEAEKVIRENEIGAQSDAEVNVFCDAPRTPPAPNAALRKAFAKYCKTVG